MTTTADPSLPADPHLLRPVIKEVVRTRHCKHALRLLIDRIHLVSSGAHGRFEAYRLWLSDTQKSIQAVVRPELHPFLTAGDIGEGSIVLLTSYRLDRAAKLSGQGNVWYFVIEDMECVGSDGRQSKPLLLENSLRRRVNRAPVISERNASVASVANGILHDPNEAAAPDGRAFVLSEQEDPGLDLENLRALARSEGFVDRKRRFEHSSTTPSPVKSKARKTAGSPAAGLLSGALQESTDTNARSPPQSPTPTSKSQPVGQTLPKANADRPALGGRTRLLPIARPLNLTPLAKIAAQAQTGHRDQLLDVLAVIVEVSPGVAKQAHLGHLPPARQLRIIDQSSQECVRLSVFVDAENFKPAVGTVALFRSVKTHRRDGGGLNAYPTDCGGTRWFLPWPWEVQGIDVQGTMNWWRQKASRDGKPNLEHAKQFRGGHGWRSLHDRQTQ